jgi:hypothetical protein
VPHRKTAEMRRRRQPGDGAAGVEGVEGGLSAPRGAGGMQAPGLPPPRGYFRQEEGPGRARQIVALVAPPSSRMFWPTMKPAWTEQRKAQAAPNSAAVP